MHKINSSIISFKSAKETTSGWIPIGAILIFIYGCLMETICISVFENTYYGPFPLAK